MMDMSVRADILRAWKIETQPWRYPAHYFRKLVRRYRDHKLRRSMMRLDMLVDYAEGLVARAARHSRNPTPDEIASLRRAVLDVVPKAQRFRTMRGAMSHIKSAAQQRH